MEFSIDLRQVTDLSGIPWHILAYDARAGRLPVTIVGRTFRLPADVAQKIVNDPTGYLAWRKATSRRRRRVVYNGEVYESVDALAQTLNTNREAVMRMIRRGEASFSVNEQVFR